MVTRALRPADKKAFKRLGKRVESIIIDEMGYRSLDAFSLEYSHLIAKPTLYHICEGKRDMKLSTLIGLAEALGVKVDELLKDTCK